MSRLMWGVVAAASLALAAPARAEATVATVATVTAMLGPVTWHAAGMATWSSARTGLSLASGSMVRTGPRAMVRLRWANGGEFRLDPLSEITVTGRDNVDLTVGQLWAKFRSKLVVPFQFQSPSATAVIRGTVLGFGVDARGGTRVDVQEGHVEVLGHGGPGAMVGPGQRVLVSPEGGLGEVGERASDAPSCNP